MAELSLDTLSESEAEDAIDALDAILELDAIGEIDIPPSLGRLLLRLEDLLTAAANAAAEDLDTASTLPLAAAGSSRRSLRLRAGRRAAVGV